MEMQFSKFIYSIKLIIYFVKRSKWFVLVLVFFNIETSYAQNLLSRSIQMPEFENVSLQEIMDEIIQKQDIYFSFNSNSLNTEQKVSRPKFQGMISEYLNDILGNKYFLKEAGRHIIITYGPQRMGVDVDWVDKKKNGMIIGVIRDVKTNNLLPNASVYERMTYQSATLSNKEGYFELNIKYPEQVVSITLSKENYRDTTITLILPIEISKSKKNAQTGYYDQYKDDESVYESYFGNLFSNSKQRLQSANLGGFFAYSPFQVSLTPGLSTHGFINSQVVNNFSLNIIGGSTAGVHGFEMAGIFNLNQYNMEGTQFAGAMNMVGGNVKGIQMAGLGNLVSRNVSGAQIAGIWNKSDTIKGLQIAGITNIAKTGSGTQIAGLTNISKESINNQITGGVNIAKKVKGIQLAGLVNIADSSDYPIGILNIIKNGKKELLVQVDESQFLGLGFRTGGRILYSHLGFGMQLNQENGNARYAYEFGLGGYLIQRPKFTLATEITQRNYLDKNFKSLEYFRSSLRIIPSLMIRERYQFFIAPSFNYSEAENPINNDKTWNFWKADRDAHSFHTGLSAGFIYRF